MEESKVCGLGSVSRFPNSVSYAPRGRDFSYFGFIPTFELILGLVVGWFYAMFMTCFVASIERILWLVENGCSGMVLGQSGVYWSYQGALWHAVA